MGQARQRVGYLFEFCKVSSDRARRAVLDGTFVKEVGAKYLGYEQVCHTYRMTLRELVQNRESCCELTLQRGNESEQ